MERKPMRRNSLYDVGGSRFLWSQSELYVPRGHAGLGADIRAVPSENRDEVYGSKFGDDAIALQLGAVVKTEGTSLYVIYPSDSDIRGSSFSLAKLNFNKF